VGGGELSSDSIMLEKWNECWEHSDMDFLELPWLLTQLVHHYCASSVGPYRTREVEEALKVRVY